MWGEVEEETGEEEITIFIISESHNKTFLRQRLVLALLVKTKIHTYCSAVLTMHNDMVTKTANKNFLENSTPLWHTIYEVLFFFSSLQKTGTGVGGGRML